MMDHKDFSEAIRNGSTVLDRNVIADVIKTMGDEYDTLRDDLKAALTDAVNANGIAATRQVTINALTDKLRKAEQDMAFAKEALDLERASLAAYDGMTPADIATLTKTLDEAVAFGRAEKERADAAQRERDEVGIQLAAAQAEIGRLQGVLGAADVVKESWGQGYDLAKPMAALSGAMAKARAVPGDVLASPTIKTSGVAGVGLHELDDDGTPAKIVAQSWKLGDDPVEGSRCVQKNGWAWERREGAWVPVNQFACLTERVQDWCGADAVSPVRGEP